MPTSKGNNHQVVAGKKRGNPKKHKDHDTENKKSLSPHPKPAAQDSTAVLSRILLVMVSIMVVVAAILVKPLVEENGFFSLTTRTTSTTTTTSGDQVDIVGNVSTWTRPQPRVGFLASRACLGVYRYLNFYCHKSLLVSGRHFRATERIEPGEVLFEIPRSLQVWDLDALRDPWIRLHLFEASHRQSGNGVGSEAYLAAFLALQLKRKEEVRDWDIELLELAYYDVLPSYDEWESTHPLLASAERMKGHLGFSEGYGVLQAYRNMIISEYEAFTDISKKFTEMVSRNEYYAARLNVLTRAIRVGRPGPEEAIKGTFLKKTYTAEQLLEDELDSYKDILGIDFEAHGCIALIPIADLFNHHPQNNVEYEYTKTELNKDGAFVVRADNRRIEKGFEPMASYGVGIVDSHLYARYGFVNGDGSAPAQITIAYHHDILNLNISAQYSYFPSTGLTTRLFESMEQPLADYLLFDDGYSECIPGPSTHPDEADLKMLKHKHLLRIANIPERWHITVPPRNPYSFPSTTHETPIVVEPPKSIPFYAKANLDMELPRATCRLMSLITSDLDGKARGILRDNLNNKTFILKDEGNDSLEYRSLMCLRRWIRANMWSFEESGDTLRTQLDRVYKMNSGGSFGTRDWGAENVRLGEMQALQLVDTIINEMISEQWGDAVPITAEYKSRDMPCPDEYQRFLFDEMQNSKYKIVL